LAFAVVGLALLNAGGCNSTKRLEADEYLLRRNKIEFENSQKKISKDPLYQTIRQQPNRRLLGVFPIYLWAYYVPNPDRAEKVNLRRLAKLEKKNEKRLARGKEPKVFKPHGTWWRETVGEAPVIYDSAATSRSVDQLEIYLIKHGWFNAEVTAYTDTLPNQRINAVYSIRKRTPYYIDSIYLAIPDVRLTSLVMESREIRTNVKAGDQFNIDKLNEERTLLTNFFRNRGYYDFNKELIYFDVDSAHNNHTVNVTLGIIPRRIPYSGDPDSLLLVPYKRYQIRSITIIDQPVARLTPIASSDTIRIGEYIVIDQNQLHVKPRALSQNVLFKPQDYYFLDRVTRTYQRMSALPIVRSTAIQFEPVSDDIDNTLLDCTISLTPAPKQNVALEWRGTNRGGFLGVSGALSYKNRNIFGGAELFEINISGGLEAQRLLTQSVAVEESTGGVRNSLTFNTLEFGPEVALTFPKFLLPIRSERFSKRTDPRTTLRANLSYQLRPDYERTRSFASITYKWSESDQKQWAISPLELSLIKIFKSELFQNQLESIGDPFLLNSFQDHFIQGTRIAYTFNSRRPGTASKNLYFYHGELESAGSTLRALYQLANAPADENGNYKILDINFAHYLKTIHDFRYYRIHNEKMNTAYRLAGGVGVPLTNLNVLPFEKSFFGGGANNIRAWQARTLGPGSFRDPERNFDKIGDILIEGNIEYRFDLIKVLEGALFVDAGNIWNIRADQARPGIDFQVDRFLSEIAVGGGIGFRFNFDFFLIRIDAAVQMKDPSLDPGERWLFQGKDRYNEYIRQINEDRPPQSQLSPYEWRWNLNLGIGYPF